MPRIAEACPHPASLIGHYLPIAGVCFATPRCRYAAGMAMHTTLASVLAEVDAFDGAPESLALSIAESLIDPEGFTMALVTDKILARGWMPDGVELWDGYRTFRYCSA